MTEAELVEHDHFIANVDEVAGGSTTDIAADTYVAKQWGSASANQEYSLKGTATEPTLGLTSTVGSNTAFNVMQPTAFMHYYIKT
jgi:hypothetical protein